MKQFEWLIYHVNCVGEMTLLQARVEMYFRFVRKRCLADMEVTTKPNLHPTNTKYRERAPLMKHFAYNDGVHYALVVSPVIPLILPNSKGSY